MRTSTEKLAAALHILANDIQSDDGIANAAILEAALRLEEQEVRIKQLEEALSCVVVSCAYLHHPKKYQHKLDEACPVEELIRKASKDKP